MRERRVKSALSASAHRRAAYLRCRWLCMRPADVRFGAPALPRRTCVRFTSRHVRRRRSASTSCRRRRAAEPRRA